MVTRAIAAPIVVDLGEDDAAAVARPHRLADADIGDRLDVLAGSQVANAELEPLRAIVVDQGCEQLSVRTDFKRAEAEIILARGLDGLIENDLVIAAADRLAIPRPVLRAARLESPPIEEIVVTDRDRAVVFLDPAFHLFEQLVDQMLVPLFPVLEIIVFGAEIVEHVGITDLRIFGVPQPVPRVVDRDPVPLVAVGPLFGLRRGRNVGLLVHASALSAPARYRKRK